MSHFEGIQKLRCYFLFIFLTEENLEFATALICSPDSFFSMATADEAHGNLSIQALFGTPGKNIDHT